MVNFLKLHFFKKLHYLIFKNTFFTFLGKKRPKELEQIM